MLSLPSRTKLLFCTEPVDMRKSFDGLFGIVRQQLQLDPLSGHLFLFVDKRRDSMKAIFWDGDGFVIWYKRLERGTWQLPATDAETLELEAHELAMILRGIDLLKLREDYQDVLHQLQLLRRWAFGARRERVVDDPRQRHLFDLDSILPPGLAAPNPKASSASESETEQEVAEKRVVAREKKRADRKLCLDALPQVHHEHDIADEEKNCSVRGSEKRIIGEDISCMLEFVPSQLHVHNHHRKKYGCTCGK